MLSFVFKQSKEAAEQKLRGKGSSSSGQSQKSESSTNNEDNVVVLTDSNFDELLMKSDELWIVEFYAPWCGHCQRLEPEWKEAANKLKGEVKVAKIDATVSTRLGQQFGISGYPTIKIFPTGKKSYSNVEDYSGNRDASSIVSWAQDKKMQYKPVLKVTQLVDETIFNEYCTNQKGEF